MKTRRLLLGFSIVFLAVLMIGGIKVKKGQWDDSVTNTLTFTTNGESINVGTDGIFDFTRDDSGTVTITASDDNDVAALTIRPGGAAQFDLGGTSTSLVRFLSNDTGDAEFLAQENGIGVDEIAVMAQRVIFCGEGDVVDGTGTTHLGPTLLFLRGAHSTDTTVGATACDDVGEVSEGDADEIVFPNNAAKVMGMWCRHDTTLGSSETVVFLMRTALGSVVTQDGSATTLTCTIAEAEDECVVVEGSTTDIAAGATMTILMTSTSDDTTRSGWCSVMFGLKS